jgi:hypothetical protein
VEQAYNEQGNRIAYTIKTENQEEMESEPSSAGKLVAG